MFTQPTTSIDSSKPHPKHHIDIDKDTAQLLKFLKKKRSDTYDDIINYLIKQTKEHQKCLQQRQKKGIGVAK